MIARIAAAVAGLSAVASAARAEAAPAAVNAVRAEAAAATAPDAAAIEAGDANLESTAHRRGVTFALSGGGGLTLGFGIKDAVGRGGSGTLRLGHVATARTVITFEINGVAVLHRPAPGSPIETNTSGNLLAGAQHYVNPSLWLRGAAGVGGYLGRQVALGDGTRGDVTLVGPAVLVGAGVDLARFKWVVIGIEAGTTLMINRDGVMVTSGGGFGLAFD